MNPTDVAAAIKELPTPLWQVFVGAMAVVFVAVYMIKELTPLIKAKSSGANGTQTAAHQRLPLCEAEKHVTAAAQSSSKAIDEVVTSTRSVAEVSRLLQETIRAHQEQARERHGEMMAQLRDLSGVTHGLTGEVKALREHR